MEQFWVSGFFIGMLGGLHCIGMCGPLALLIPGDKNSKFKYFLNTILYHTSRVVGYMFLGIIAGIAGFKIKLLIGQQILSIVVGVILLIILVPKLFPIINHIGLVKILNQPVEKFQQFIQQVIYKTFAKKYGLILMGFLNAFLPCGLVYVALSNALVIGNIKNSMLTMMAFGLATLPYLFIVAIGKSFILKSKLLNRNKFVLMMNLMIACLLVLRGLNLNIPYLSPGISYENAKIKECCNR